jgi:Ca-activated chloride channel family protein
MSFASPWLLLAALAVPALIALAAVIDRRSARYPVAFTNLHVLAEVVPARKSRWKRFIPVALLALALVFAAGALAHPRLKLSKPDQNATIVLLVDVSGSMRANDVEPTRLDAAVAAMRTFLDRLPKQFKVGLVTFSSEPEPLIAPTSDRDTLRQSISLLEPEAGTAVGDGIATAVKMLNSALKQAGYVRKSGQEVPGAIVLLSDGAQTRGELTPLQGAALARTAGIRVFTVALGTNNGTLDPGAFGFGFGGGGGGGLGFNRRFPVRPDPVTLAAIARATDGQTFRAESASKVQQIYKQLGRSIAHKAASREVSSWFAGVAALLLLLSLGTARLTGERLP